MANLLVKATDTFRIAAAFGAVKANSPQEVLILAL
jgi:hypothetical protein